MTLITGIDASSWQGAIDWPRVKEAGFTFGIAKATEWVKPRLGAKRVAAVDKRFARNWEGMRAAGLIRGAYLFFHPECDPIAQAEHFAKTVGPLGPGDLMPWLDVEAHDGMKGPDIVARAKACLEALEALTGRWPGVYTGEWFWRGWLANRKHWPAGQVGADVLASWPVWIADYDVPMPNTLAWPNWMIWQHDVAEAGVVPGVPRPAKCDLNYFGGTLDELRGLAGIGAAS